MRVRLPLAAPIGIQATQVCPEATVTLAEVSCGTELNVVQQGIPDVIPLEACYLGWQESLKQLMQLVEAQVPG